jgi:hypothetical protein
MPGNEQDQTIVPNWVVRKIDEHQSRLDGLDREVLKLRILIEKGQANHEAVMSLLQDIKVTQEAINARLAAVQSDRDKVAGVVAVAKWLGFGGVMAILTALILTQTSVLNVQPARPPEEKIERVLPGG